jgi:hypothetical protein
MTNYREATTGFVNSAKGVAGAVDMLKAAISGGDPEDINFTTELVTGAADNYLGHTETYQRRGLDEIAIRSPEAVFKQERVAADLLAGALMDLNVGNTILNVAHVAEHPEAAASAELDANSEQLNNVINVVALPLGRSVETPISTARFGIDEAPETAPLPASNDAVVVKKQYEEQVTEVFTLLVAKSKEVVLTTFESIKGLDLERLLAGLGSVGQLAANIPHVSKLAAKGIAIVVQALEKISDLLNIGKEVETIRTLARRVREYMNDPTRPLEELLEFSYAATRTKELVRQKLDQTSAAVAEIGEAAKELVQLRNRFADQMTLLNHIVGGVAVAKRLVNFFTPEATTLPFFGTFYVVAMAYSILAGMDFADAGGTNLVYGVLQISERVLV